MRQREPIESFRGKHRFLSNFHPSTVELDGDSYPNVEAAFQSAKTFNPSEREEIRKLTNPVMAKRKGRRVTLRPDWEKIKLDIMRSLVLQKFTRHEPLRAQLLATGDADLIETIRGRQSWNNHLGKILMDVRRELQSQVGAEMHFQVTKLNADSIGRWKYGQNSLIDDSWLAQDLDEFDSFYGLIHDGTLLWTVLPFRDSWVATTPITCAVFEYYLKHFSNSKTISLESEESELSYYLYGPCGGPGFYEFNQDTCSSFVYMSDDTASVVADDLGMEFVGNDVFEDLFWIEGDDTTLINNGISFYASSGFSIPVGGTTYQGAKEWGNAGMMFPIAKCYRIMIQGFEHAYLRLSIPKDQVALI